MVIMDYQIMAVQCTFAEFNEDGLTLYKADLNIYLLLFCIIGIRNGGSDKSALYLPLSLFQNKTSYP